MGIAGDVKDLLSISIKTRHDAYTDQFSRIFLVKLMMCAAFFTGMNWYSDKINCIVPESLGTDPGFVSSACWINGFYIYRDFGVHKNGDLGYYGMPRDLADDGKMDSTGSLCRTRDKQSGRLTQGCTAMKKTFFVQYQYMVFFLAVLSLFYYMPYCIFRVVNTDMISLKETIKDKDPDAILKNYFDYNISPRKKMRMRILLNLFVKVLYIAVNVLCLLMTDKVLGGYFLGYGQSWTLWSTFENEKAYNYMGLLRDIPKPGNEMLPAYGFCEVHEALMDVKTSLVNKYKFVCEFSQHILYQYVFIILWYAMIFGILVSVLGLLVQLLDHCYTITCFLKQGSPARKMYKRLTLRECEYLEFIRRKDLPLYGEVLRKLKEDRFSDFVNGMQPSSPLTKEDMM